MNGTTPTGPPSPGSPHDRAPDGPGGEEPTAVFPSFAQDQRQQQAPYGQPYPSYGPNPAQQGPHPSGAGGFGSPTAPPPRQPKPPRRGAGIIVAAIVAGALAGTGGAVGYSALTDDPPQAAAQQSPTSSSGVADSKAPSGSVEAVAAAVLPSVVKIDVSGPGGTGSGSGIILTADGTIVTNNHVVEVAADGGELAVSFNDGTSAKAKVVGTDPMTDVAVIQAEDVDGLTPAKLGQSAGVDVGEQVVAVGSPFGLESTVTSGIVSALDRPVSAGQGERGGPATVFPAIQTDAAINPGNSGGALVNMKGEVVGINSAIRSTPSAGGEAGFIGLGFAIPIDEAKPIAEQLRKGDTATHARLGVTVGTPTNKNGLPGGAEVQSVENGSAGEKAGLREGDVITKIDDRVISSSDALVAMVRSYRPDDDVTLTVVRGGDEQEIDVTLGSDEGDNNT
ncbi:MAG: PDZ domain-containing protein [Propionibacteriales bacterium]|nr:PDZ domain-containing protein [Propionibacteriales bacterium]